MRDASPLLSICVPSYNRPDQLLTLLRSVDCRCELIEIIICEDVAPRRLEVRQAVAEFRQGSPYEVLYEENPTNLGYDGNLRRLIELAKGVFVLFMGDDDWFNPGTLDEYLDFLDRQIPIRDIDDVAMTATTVLNVDEAAALTVKRGNPLRLRHRCGPDTDIRTGNKIMNNRMRFQPLA